MKPAQRETTREDVLKIYDYNPETGHFTHMRLQRRAGTVKSSGYRQMNLCGFSELEHRLAWLVMTGVWPLDQIDHINRDKGDNRFCNLRLASARENRHNNSHKSVNASSQYIGVSFQRDRKRTRPWRSVIRPNGRKTNLHLGYFATEEEAATAYHKMARQYYGKFAPPSIVGA